MGGVFIVMTDHQSLPDIWMKMRTLDEVQFVNHCVWKNEWGNHGNKQFNPCFDNVLIFSKLDKKKFDTTCIQIPKVTMTKGLNPSGRDTKTATAFITDICMHTNSLERVKKDDGHLLQWQKPLKLMSRVILPFVNRGDAILDLFMGSGTLAEWSIIYDMNYIGIENDPNVYKLALKRINRAKSIKSKTAKGMTLDDYEKELSKHLKSIGVIPIDK
jgi:adenine specific DNA methylase Mod